MVTKFNNIWVHYCVKAFLKWILRIKPHGSRLFFKKHWHSMMHQWNFFICSHCKDNEVVVLIKIGIFFTSKGIVPDACSLKDFFGLYLVILCKCAARFLIFWPKQIRCFVPFSPFIVSIKCYHTPLLLKQTFKHWFYK